MSERKQWDQYVTYIQEDECLTAAVAELGTGDWSMVSDYLKVKFGNKIRSGKKCRERWNNHVNPNVSKTSWSIDEQKTLFRCHEFYGNQWTEIARFLSGRTDNSVKNHFYTTLRRKIRWYNKQVPVEQRVLMSANEVSMDPELSKKILETPDNRKPVKSALM